MELGGNDNGDREDAPASRYDDELLSANWNPVVGLLGRGAARAADDGPRFAPGSIREEDADAFLGRFYAAGF